MPGLTPVVVGLDLNLGEPDRHLVRADTAGKELEIDALSSLYRSQPVGYATQPDFRNVVCLVRAHSAPGELLRTVQQIEENLGHSLFPNAPRTIDIDLLAYGDLFSTHRSHSSPPRLHQRAFVLVPLAEIAPNWRHPSSARPRQSF